MKTGIELIAAEIDRIQRMSMEARAARALVAAARADGSALGALPENWLCKECGKPAWQYACVRALAEVNYDDRATLDQYGADKSQFLDADEIELCGYCGGSRWQAPNLPQSGTGESRAARALAAARADGWKQDISPATEMSNENWFSLCPTQPPIREETLIDRYWDKVK